jgi:formamidopyrimidine-DNA glycosylase
MPELPDVELYRHALERRLLGEVLRGIRIGSPFVLRSVEPSPSEASQKRVRELRRLGKRIVLGLEDDLFVIVHLMIAGRFRWRPAGQTIPKRIGLAAFDFDQGTLLLTEVSKKKRASIHLVRGEAALAAHDPGGIEPLETDLQSFAAALTRENHTVKRTLTDPRVLSGIGNAYSDEILHRAKLSPLLWTQRLSEPELHRLYQATQEVLREWIERLCEQTGDGFPEKVSAFRPQMAVHGKFGEPCPVCGAPVQRIVFSERETNYCARCQTGGRRLADRALSRLLKDDWPRKLDEES